MSTEQSKLTTGVDFEAEGRQFGHLSAPNSTNASGWGTLLLPIVCVKGGDGPTVLFTGGNHGDEYEGPLTLLKLAQELRADTIQGRVLIIPGLNFPALQAGTRLSPLDGANMNRAFPGARDRSMTYMIADYVYRHLLPIVDVVVDMHSGGSSMIFEPSVVMHHLDNQQQMNDTLAALHSFGAPVAQILRELDSGGMLDTAVEGMGKIFLSTELGGGGFVTPTTLKIGDLGVRNVLRHFGLLDGDPQPPETIGLPASRLMEVPASGGFVMALEDGLYEVLAEVGDELAAGHLLGRIYDPARPQRAATEVHSPRAGRLTTRAGRGWVRRGDTVGVISVDYEPA